MPKVVSIDDVFGPADAPTATKSNGKVVSIDDVFGPPPPAAPPSLWDSFKEGLKQGSFYKGYLAPDSNYVAPPTPEEQAYFQQHRTLPPPAAPPAPNGVAGTVAQGLGDIIGKIPEYGVGGGVGMLTAGPIGAAAGGMGLAEGGATYMQPNSTPGQIALDAARGAATGAVMEGAGMVGGKALGRLVGGAETTAAIKAAQKAADDALEAFRAAPSAKTKAAALAAQQAVKDATPTVVRVGTEAGRIAGMTAGAGTAGPATHGQWPTVKDYSDALALTLSFEAIGGINAVRKARAEIKRQQAAGATPQQAYDAAAETVGLRQQDMVDALQQGQEQPAPAQWQVGPQQPALTDADVPEIKYAPKSPGSAVYAPEQLPAVPNEKGTPFAAVPGGVDVQRPSAQPSLRIMTRDGQPASVQYKQQYLIDMLNSLPPEMQEKWLDQALTRTGDAPPAPTGRVTGTPDMQTGAEPEPMQRATGGPPQTLYRGIGPKQDKSKVTFAAEREDDARAFAGNGGRIVEVPLSGNEKVADLTIGARDINERLKELVPGATDEQVSNALQSNANMDGFLKEAGYDLIKDKDPALAGAQYKFLNPPNTPSRGIQATRPGETPKMRTMRGREVQPVTERTQAADAGRQLARDYNQLTPEEQDAWAAQLLGQKPEEKPSGQVQEDGQPQGRAGLLTSSDAASGGEEPPAPAPKQPWEMTREELDKSGVTGTKVSDESGNPLLMYHQSFNLKRGDAFNGMRLDIAPGGQVRDPNRGGADTLGMWFTSDLTQPSMYSHGDLQGRKKSILPAYIKAHNVLEFNGMDEYVNWLKKYATYHGRGTQIADSDMGAVRERLRLGKKDAIVIHNAKENPSDKPATWVAVVNPESIVASSVVGEGDLPTSEPPTESAPRRALGTTLSGMDNTDNAAAVQKLTGEPDTMQGMREALSKYHDTGESTYQDFVDEIRGLVDSGDAPKVLQKYINAYDKAAKLHKESGFRMDTGEAEADALADVVRKKVGSVDEPIKTEEKPGAVDFSGIKSAQTKDDVHSEMGRIMSSKPFPSAKQQAEMRSLAQKRIAEIESGVQSPTPDAADATVPTDMPPTTIPARTGELRQIIKSAHEPKVIVAKDPAGMLEAADYLLTKDLPRNQVARLRKIKAVAERSGAKVADTGVVDFSNAKYGDVYKVKMRDGDRYAVRENMDSPRGAGDTLWNSPDEAKSESQKMQARKKAKDEYQAQAAAKKEAADKVAADKKAQREDLSGFTDSMSALQKGKVVASLDKKFRDNNGKVWSRREWIKNEVENNGAKAVENEVPDEAARKKAADEVDRMNKGWVPIGNENHPETIRYRELQKRAKSATKKEYTLNYGDGRDRVVTKIEYDYAKHLNDTQPAPAPAVGGAPSKKQAQAVVESKVTTEKGMKDAIERAKNNTESINGMKSWDYIKDLVARRARDLGYEKNDQADFDAAVKLHQYPSIGDEAIISEYTKLDDKKYSSLAQKKLAESGPISYIDQMKLKERARKTTRETYDKFVSDLKSAVERHSSQEEQKRLERDRLEAEDLETHDPKSTYYRFFDGRHNPVEGAKHVDLKSAPPGTEFFISNPRKGLWEVVESSSGARVSSASKRQLAIEEANNSVGKYSPEEFNKIVLKAREQFGTTPRYRAIDDTAPLDIPKKFTPSVHDQLIPHFERIHAAAKTAAQFMREAVKQFGENVKPYAKRFLAKIKEDTGAIITPKGIRDAYNKEYRQGYKDAEKIEKALSAGEARAEERDAATKRMDAALTRAARDTQRETSRVAKDQYKVGADAERARTGADKQALAQFVAEVKKITPPELYNRRVKALQKAIAAKNTAGFDRIIEQMRTEITHAKAVDRLQETLKKLPTGKADAEIMQRVADLKSKAERVVERGDGKSTTERRKYLNTLSLGEIRKLQGEAENIQLDHALNSKEIADRMAAARAEDTKLAPKDVAEVNKKEHGKDLHENQTVARWLKNNTMNHWNLVQEVAKQGSHVWKRLFEDPMKGYEKELRTAQDSAAVRQALLEKRGVTPKDLQKLNDETQTVGGVKMTGAEKIDLLLHLRDSDTRTNVLQKDHEGFVLSRSKGLDRLKMTPELAAQIEASATPKERAVADALFEWTNGHMKDVTNEWSRGALGYDKFTRDDYWNRRRKLEDSEPAVSLQSSNVKKLYAEAMGFLKDREGGTAPIFVDNVFNHAESMNRATAKLVGSLNASINARRLMDNSAFRDAVLRRRRDGAYLLSAVQRGLDEVGMVNRVKEKDAMYRAVRAVGRGLTTAKLSLNLPVIISQPFSTLSATRVIPAKHILAKFATTVWDRTAKKEIDAYSPILSEIISGTGHDIITPGSNDSTQALRAFGVDQRTISDKAMSAVQKMNDVAVFQIWDAAKAWGKEKGLTGDALMEFTNEKATAAWLQTQPSNHPLFAAGIKLDAKTSSAAYAFTMFQGQTAIQFHDAASAIREYRNGEGTAAGMLARVARPLLLQAVMFNAFKFGVEGARRALMGDTEQDKKRDKDMSPGARVAYNTLMDVAGSAPGLNAITDGLGAAIKAGVGGKSPEQVEMSTPVGEFGKDSLMAAYQVSRALQKGQMDAKTFKAVAKLADVTGLPIEKTFDYIQWLHDLRK